MINRVVLLGRIDGVLNFATTKKGDRVCYFMLRTWHRWFDPASKQARTKQESHLVTTLRSDLVSMLERRTTIDGLVFVEGALSGIMDLSEGESGRLRSAVVVHRDGQIRFIGGAGDDAADESKSN
jgi:single-stranded DNA-binding protein